MRELHDSSDLRVSKDIFIKVKGLGSGVAACDLMRQFLYPSSAWATEQPLDQGQQAGCLRTCLLIYKLKRRESQIGSDLNHLGIFKT